MSRSVAMKVLGTAAGLLGAAAPAPAGGPQTPATTAPVTEQPASTQESARPLVIIEGQCFDALGAGVKDVKVVAKLQINGANLQYINTATTNDTGDFAIMSAKPIRGNALVTLTKWGFKDESREVELIPGELPPFVDVQLEGAVIVFGIVTDARSGAPIPRATVHVETGGNEWTATSDQDGKFRVSGLHPGRGVVVVDAKGYGRMRQYVARFEDFGELIILLRPERAVQLKTVDIRGDPVSGVRVECFAENTEDYLSGTTDEKGEILFRGVNVDATEFLVRLEHDEYICSVGFDRKIEISPGETTSRHEMILAPAGTVSGTITEAENGEPVIGARVVVGEGVVDALPKAWSDFEGAYRVIGVPPGPNVVTVHLSGYAPELKEVATEASKDVRADFALRPGHTVGGVVVDGDGKPVPSAYIGATRWRSRNTLWLQALTDEQGRFILTSAPPDEFTVTVTCRGYTPLKNATVRGGKTDYRFELLAASPGKTQTRIKIGDDAPPLELVTLDGKPLKLADLRGRWVVLNFWATWCGFCRTELPHLKAVHDAHGQGRNLTILGISLDDDEKAFRKFIEKNSLGWTHVLGEKGGARKAANIYGAEVIPALFVIDPKGKVAAVDLRGPGMIGAIEKLMNAEAQPGPGTSEDE
ncbi:MAG: carboxypeptidase regulatory-like domain-containing protein [Phycisphaerales bacterium]|nr:MAG: carboxypeptidase regulatory-like domain-containing protein [Phycisphaerales bacterium]